MFDNRQLATLILLGAFLAWAVSRRSVRQSSGTVVRQAASPKILGPFLLYGAWLASLHYLAWRAGLWNTQLVGESIFWAAPGAAFLMNSATDAGKKDNFFRDRTVETIKLGAFFEFFLNIKSFSLVGELLLLPIAVLLSLVRVVAAHDEKFRSARRPLDVVLTLMTLGLLAYTIVSLVQDWSVLDKGQELRKLAMPIWLTLGAMPFAFVTALIASYGQVFSRMNFTSEEKRASLRAKVGVMLGLRTRLLDIHSFAGRSSQRAGRTKTIRGAVAVVRDDKAERRRKAADEQAQVDRLEAFAGVEGTDDEGRQLDQREFTETKTALRWLATCQMGWHNNRGKRYRSELLAALGDFQGLPADHGIVLKVRKDGKAWYAYRRTVTGWVFGIGSRKKPPDQWFYDGPEPPTSYPQPGHGWGDQAHVDTVVNW